MVSRSPSLNIVASINIAPHLMVDNKIINQIKERENRQNMLIPTSALLSNFEYQSNSLSGISLQSNTVENSKAMIEASIMILVIILFHPENPK